jgi:two-component system, NarL family, response regulator NreC
MRVKRIKVVIADDHEIFRDGLVMLLKSIEGIEVIGEAKNGEELVNLVLKRTPNIVLTDIKMPKLDGIQATKKILSKQNANPNANAIGIIALTMFEEGDQILEMIEAGAMGYLIKNASKEEMEDAIFTVHNKLNYYCKQTSAKIAKLIAAKGFHPSNRQEKVTFKEVELEIIRLICSGATSKEIGEGVLLSYRTVEGYRAKIQEKMQVENAAGIIKYAIKHNLIEDK